jgi:hypothetical protein
MYILKALEVFSKKEYAMKADCIYPDHSEIVRVPLPEGKTFDDVQEWKMLAEGEIKYRMKGETDYRYFKP